MTTKFKVKRTATVFPTIEYFWHTGEQYNPYRCSDCIENKKFPLIKLEEINKFTNVKPTFCRKCGINF